MSDPTETDPRPWEQLEQVAATGDAAKIEQFLDSLPAGEAARAISRLDEAAQNRVLTTLPPHDAADLIEDCPQAEAVELIEHLPAENAAAIIQQLPSAHAADLIIALPHDKSEAILAQMEPADAAEARQLAAYKPDQAGGLMATEFLAYRETMTAGEVVDDLRANAEKYADYEVQYVYCLSPFGELVGVLRLRDLLLTPRHRVVADFMIRKPLSVGVYTALEQLAEIFNRHAFFGVPVTDKDGKLVGVVRRRDVEEALVGRAESDYLKSQGIVGGEELRTMPVRVRSVRRLSWLSLNIVLNILAASVIAFHQDTLAQVIALAVFLPIISDMSGCAGNQAVAVSMRELALGMVKPREMARVLVKEMQVGVINGVVLGVLIALVAWLWKGTPWLGAVAGAALAINTLIAVSIGGLLPLFLKLLGRDPALASGPILTTVTDTCGFFLTLTFATLAMPYLTAGQ